MQTDTTIIEIAPGLWIWRTLQTAWAAPEGVDRMVTSTCVASGGEVAVIDPLAPPEAATDVWERLEAQPPTMGIVLKPDHVRSIDAFVARFGCRAYGPDRFTREEIPETDLDWIYPSAELPGGFVALYDGRDRTETPLWLPEQRTIVFSDALTTLGGELQVWWTAWHEERVLPALRAMLDLPFERVIISHGDPVHDRAEFERALARQPFGGDF